MGLVDQGEVNVLADKTEPRPGPRDKDGKPDNSGMREALRSVYQKTVEEQVPDEFLDLLGRLD